MGRIIDIRPTKDKIAEIEEKQNFSSDWFEESLQEMADWVETKWLHEYGKLAQQYTDAISIRDMRIAELEEKLREIMDKQGIYCQKSKYYSEPLTVERLTAAGWECNVSREHPYKWQFRKEGERFNEFCCDVMFVVFEDGKVSVYYYDDTTNHKVDIRRNGQITVREFNALLDIVKLEKFKI